MKVTSTPPQQPKVETPHPAAAQAQQKAQTLAKPAEAPKQPAPAPAHLGKNVDTNA